MKHTINEERSISEIVTKTSDRLYNLIEDDVKKKIEQNDDVTFSDLSNATYCTNTFEFPVSDIAPNVGTVKVEYYIYVCEDYDQYNQLVRQGLNINSEFDYDSKYLRLVGAWISKKLDNEFKSTVYHEITHLFQYSKGIKKRKELYDICIEFSGSPIDAKRIVGRLTYYTFPHEQDAMVHQFYADLMEMNPDKNFEECLTEISEYKNIIEGMNFLSEHGEEAVPYIYQLGMSVKQWLRIFHYADRRIINKMRNAYAKFRMDKSKRNINENTVSFDLYLESLKHHKNLKHGLESFYAEYSLPNEGLFTKYLD